jgi:hypothetical protein
MRSFMFCTSPQRWTMSWKVRVASGRRRMHRGSWWENLKETTTLMYLGVDGMIILKWILKKSDGIA